MSFNISVLTDNIMILLLQDIVRKYLSNGHFSFMVIANSLAEPNKRWSKPFHYYINDSTLSAGLNILIPSLIVGFIGATGFIDVNMVRLLLD